MPDFKEQYKNPRLGFGDVDHRRYLRAYNHDKSRKEVRTRTFDKNRNLQGISAPTSPILDERKKKLIKWKEERNRKKKLEAATKKPAFKVGVVHHPLCSSLIKNDMSTTNLKIAKETEAIYAQRRITRATEKRLLAKAAAAKQELKNTLAFTSIKHSKIVKTPTSNTKKQKSFAPANYCFKPPSGLKKLPLFGLVPIKQTPQEKDVSLKKSCGQVSDITAKLETFAVPSLSLNKEKSSLELSESLIHELNTVDELNTTLTSSLRAQTTNQRDIKDSFQEDKSLSNSDMKTPPLQKITPTSFEKENCSMEDLIIFSPYLTRSRGKRNSRKEGQQRLGISRPSNEIPTKDTVMQNLNICIEEEERTAQYFKLLLNKETDRLKELCKKWLDIKLEKDVPEDAMYEIQQAVGQTNLLINKKFERFRGLVQDCETGRGEMLVTCRDLQGFWDMTYMEVKDCDTRFEKLEHRRNKAWQEEEECLVARPAVKKRTYIKKQIVSSKPSSLRSLILAARKKKMETGTLDKEDLLLQDMHINKEHVTSNKNSFDVLSEERIDTRCNKRSKSYDLNENKSTSSRHESFKENAVQKAMQFSQTKKMKSPFAAMKISRMCKTPEVQLDDTISYVNSDQTPGKSILKKSEELVNKDRIKSAHKVNFNERIVLTEVPLDEEMETKLSLAAALNRIDSLDLNNLSPQECINAERKLNFEVEDSDNNDDPNELVSKIQAKEKQGSSYNRKIRSPRKNLRNRRKDRSSKKDNIDILLSTSSSQTVEVISKNMEDIDLGIKVLRNRTISMDNTPKSNRTSRMMTPKKENGIEEERTKNSVKSSRKSSLKLLRKDENKYRTPNKNIIEIENVGLIENIAKRRSVRKSVAFDETCVGCSENKAVLPMTPHTRNNTSLRRSKHTLNDDLTS
ncbi:disks large-associated protein 5 [Pogonomyrmex barbatus]|uniref:Disks large-associated protein 5 n=1 Tax=Pogonomyrmex barbatus TaxID=144034 RepID=A0A6I9WEK2_9HYME|nr:disks large-associated protein 5 [Pogonomyrmex barbatus]